MNWDRVSGEWKQFGGQVQERRGTLTEYDLTKIAGKRDQLCGLVLERYGYDKDQAEKAIDEFARALKS